MEERNAVDILIDYPKKNGLQYDTHLDYRRFYLFPGDPILNTKFVVFKTGSVFFHAYDSYATKVNITKTYTGLYRAIELLGDTELIVYKKSWLDYFLRLNKRTTGLKHIDDYLTITSDSKTLPFFLTNQAVTIFMEMNRKFSPFQLIVLNDYQDNISELKGQKVIGLETQQWLYKDQDVDSFINLGSQLIDNISKTGAQ